MSTDASKRVVKHLRHKKLMYVLMLGGKCSEPGCDYNKNLAALEFHHPNGKDKDLENWRSPKFKVEECILYCSNHHREHHHPELNNFNDTTDEERSRQIKEGLAKRKAHEDAIAPLANLETPSVSLVEASALLPSFPDYSSRLK